MARGDQLPAAGKRTRPAKEAPGPLLACIARNPWLVFDAIGPRRLDGATCNASAARVALMIRRKSPAAREAAAGPSGGSPRESRGTGRAGAIGSQIASRRKLAIPVYVPSISVAARGPRRPANEKPGEFYGRTLSAYSPGEMKRPLIRGDAAEAMIDDLRFKVVRSNGTDEILARAINLLNARARVGVFCSHPRRSK
jgi:hypothetical protein